MIGQRLRELRKERGITQEELGRLIGVTNAAISGYERDERTPDPPELIKLAEVFGVTTDYLLGLDDARKTIVTTIDEVREARPIYNAIPDDDPDVRARIDELLKLFAGLSPVSRESILDMAKFLTMKDRENTAKPVKKTGKNRHDI